MKIFYFFHYTLFFLGKRPDFHGIGKFYGIHLYGFIKYTGLPAFKKPAIPVRLFMNEVYSYVIIIKSRNRITILS